MPPAAVYFNSAQSSTSDPADNDETKMPAARSESVLARAQGLNRAESANLDD